ncbi:MAG: CopG family transcriptional regulator [Gammaproteobacteria bacterium]|nr:CopG family transcriptional regulator [Gammaproteobacteria bacterium]MCY4270000.1 CopG family transcriptional regulator [Gammaproteobacteria bacterium]MCY4295779.1 CopG family transcriptional regulator [Gammaproteobacteria bacterium]
MNAKDFDQKFDSGTEDVIADLDMRTLSKAGREHRRVNVDFPIWMIESLDREAGRIGVTRQSIIKMWLAEKLESVRHSVQS